MSVAHNGRIFAVCVVSFLCICSGVVTGFGFNDDAQNDSKSLGFLKGFFQGNIYLTYNVSQIPSTIRPEIDIVRVNVEVSHFVSGLGSRLIIPFFRANTIPIELKVGKTPDWLMVNVAPGVVYPRLGTVKPDTPEIVIISISLTSNAPAFQTHAFEVVAEHSTFYGMIFPLVQPTINKIPVEITPGLYANLQLDHQRYVRSPSQELVKVMFNFTNLGNARMLVRGDIPDPPSGWFFDLESELFIGTKVLGEDNTGQMELDVIAPRNFTGRLLVPVQFVYSAAGHPEQGIFYMNTTVTFFND
jgi:hypothetical protein